MHKKLRKAPKNKQSFEKEDRLFDYIFVLSKDFKTNNWMKYPLSKFNDWNQQTQSYLLNGPSKEKAIEIAKSMLKKSLTVSLIQEVIDLSKETIEQLKKSL